MQKENHGSIYANFASVYDYLMTDIPYDAWVQYLQKLFGYFGIKPTRILDLGCGTGNISIPLAGLGYQVTGVDMSPEMLSMAEQKARERGLELSLICQDMRELDLPQEFDLVISMVDSFNYLIEDGDIVKTLDGIGQVLKQGGWLVFDLNSAYKIKHLFGNNTYTHVEDKVCYIWQNEYDPETKACEMELTFFVQKDNGYFERFTECHRERAFEEGEIAKFLSQSGFSLKTVFKELGFEKPNEKEERIFVIAKKL